MTLPRRAILKSLETNKESDTSHRKKGGEEVCKVKQWYQCQEKHCSVSQPPCWPVVFSLSRISFTTTPSLPLTIAPQLLEVQSIGNALTDPHKSSAKVSPVSTAKLCHSQNEALIKMLLPLYNHRQHILSCKSDASSDNVSSDASYTCCVAQRLLKLVT